MGRRCEPYADVWLPDVSLSIYPVRDEDGTIIGASATTRDITQSQRETAALAGSQRRFRMAFDEAPTVMALVGLQGEFLQVNRVGCELVGSPCSSGTSPCCAIWSRSCASRRCGSGLWSITCRRRCTCMWTTPMTR